MNSKQWISLILNNLILMGLLLTLAYQLYFLIFEAPYVVDGIIFLIVWVLTAPLVAALAILRTILSQLINKKITKWTWYLLAYSMAFLFFTWTVLFNHIIFMILGAIFTVFIFILGILEVYHFNREPRVKNAI